LEESDPYACKLRVNLEGGGKERRREEGGGGERH